MKMTRQATEERYEWATLEWLDKVFRRILTEAVRPEQLKGLSLVTSYEYTDPPAHLLREGRKSVGWRVVIEDGALQVLDGPLPASESDVQIVADYAVSRELRLMAPGSDEEQRLNARATAEGKIKVTGNMARFRSVVQRTPLPTTADAITAGTR